MQFVCCFYIFFKDFFFLLNYALVWLMRLKVNPLKILLLIIQQFLFDYKVKISCFCLTFLLRLKQNDSYMIKRCNFLVFLHS